MACCTRYACLFEVCSKFGFFFFFFFFFLFRLAGTDPSAWAQVGNNFPVFFVRDGRQFPDMVLCCGSGN